MNEKTQQIILYYFAFVLGLMLLGIAVSIVADPPYQPDLPAVASDAPAENVE